MTPPETWDDLAAKHGIRLKKSLGQHILTDSDTTQDIVRLAGVRPGDQVIEIGPGLGTLTLELVKAGADVLAIETDISLEPALTEVLSADTAATSGTVRLVWENADNINWATFLKEHSPEHNPEHNQNQAWKLVANLPYNIATGLVLDILQDAPQIQTMTVMLQEEVAERLAARAGSSAYGVPSVKTAYWGKATVLKRVPPTAFRPPPKVNSAVLQIVRHTPPKIAPEDLFPLVEKAFNQRRKMLRKSLRDVLPSKIFIAADINPESRPQDLDLEAWVKLAQEARTCEKDSRSSLGSSLSSSSSSSFSSNPNNQVILAPAKLTLSLHITGVRGDGYHLIDAEMVTLDFADELLIEEGEGLVMITDQHLTHQNLTNQGPRAVDNSDNLDLSSDNLIAKALALANRQAKITVIKRIPLGAGLGGGSANAAAVLRWAGIDDLGAAATLGADVPFCLVGGRAQVGGIGEIIQSLPPKPAVYTLLTPPFGCSTQAVYKTWDEMGAPKGENGNDLEPAALKLEPRLAKYRDQLGEISGQTPRLAGSGSTWFVEGDHPAPGHRLVRTAS